LKYRAGIGTKTSGSPRFLRRALCLTIITGFEPGRIRGHRRRIAISGATERCCPK
jgi:hypothetical protein